MTVGVGCTWAGLCPASCEQDLRRAIAAQHDHHSLPSAVLQGCPSVVSICT
jgi:hypothetical protein